MDLITAVSFHVLGYAGEVLVAAAGQIKHHQMLPRLARSEIHDASERMRRLECRNDAFEARAELKRRYRLLVGRGKILHPFYVIEPSVLGANARIVETG